jgi:acyl-[acyl-carrier-protein] desaturase
MCYVTLQELATRISHRNTGARIDDKAGYDIMRRVAIDENHHFLFYRDLASAGFELDASLMVINLEDQVLNFAMPGTGIPDFAAHSKLIAKAGIYDVVAHYEQILEPVVLRHWGLPDLAGLTPEADAARERIVAFIDKTGRVANRTKERRARTAGDLVGSVSD